MYRSLCVRNVPAAVLILQSWRADLEVNADFYAEEGGSPTQAEYLARFPNRQEVLDLCADEFAARITEDTPLDDFIRAVGTDCVPDLEANCAAGVIHSSRDYSQEILAASAPLAAAR